MRTGWKWFWAIFATVIIAIVEDVVFAFKGLDRGPVEAIGFWFGFANALVVVSIFEFEKLFNDNGDKR